MIKTSLINSDKDIHVCGICQNIYDNINKFLNHKLECPLNRKFIIGSTQLSVKQQSLLKSKNNKQDHVNGNSHSVKSGAITLNNQLKDDLATAGSPIKKPVQLVENSLNRSLLSITTDKNQELKKTARNLTSACPVQKNKNKLSKSDSVKKMNKNVETCTTKSKLKIQCDICDFKAKFRRDLLRHMKKHTREQPYECCYCGKRFSRKDKQANHERIHRGDRPFKCGKCEYAGSDSSALRLHQLTHTGERRHRCQMCPYKARSASHLSVHLRTHTGDSPYFCRSDSCGRSFKTSSDLNRHVKIHKPDVYSSYKDSCKKYSIVYDSEEMLKSVRKSCYICQDFINIRRFSSNKRGRKLRHTHCIKSHECPHCDASFVREDSLRCHIKIHNIPSTGLDDEGDICNGENDSATLDRPLEGNYELNPLNASENDFIPLETLMQCAIDTSTL